MKTSPLSTWVIHARFLESTLGFTEYLWAGDMGWLPLPSEDADLWPGTVDYEINAIWYENPASAALALAEVLQNGCAADSYVILNHLSY